LFYEQTYVVIIPFRNTKKLNIYNIAGSKGFGVIKIVLFFFEIPANFVTVYKLVICILEVGEMIALLPKLKEVIVLLFLRIRKNNIYFQVLIAKSLFPGLGNCCYIHYRNKRFRSSIGFSIVDHFQGI